MRSDLPPEGPTPAADRPRTPWAVHLVCYVLLVALLAWILVQHYLRPLVFDEPVGVAKSPAADGVPGSISDGKEQLDERINPNTATWAELTRLPGIGETKARRIVEYRLTHRPPGSGESSDDPVFRRPEDLERVSGIGPKTVERMRPFLRFPDAGMPAGSTD